MSTRQEVVAFLPCRKGSQRVKNKNTRDFAGIKGGLTFIKISQILKVDKVKKIIVSTDDERVKKIALSFNDKKIIIDNRPKELTSSQASTDDLIKYVPKIINQGIILWTHVTSPFVNEKIYDDAIEKYFQLLVKFDSLLSVTKIQIFLWDEHGPINYDRDIEKWPRTQTIKPLFEVNSGIFLADVEIYKNLSDRIGVKPHLYELDEITSFDIDWEVNFKLAEEIWKNEKI